MFRAVGKYLRNSFARIDKKILIFSMIITLMSLVTIFSARENFGNSKFVMQFAMTAVGMCAVLVIVNIDYRMLVDRYWILLLLV